MLKKPDEVDNYVLGARDDPDVVDLSVGSLALLDHAPTEIRPSSAYSPLGGLPSLRAAIATFEGVPINRVTITTGAMGALLTCLALSDRRGEVLLPTPYFPAYPTLVTALGHTPMYYDVAGEGDAVLREAISKVGPGTLAVFWNFPHNPSGRVDDGVDLTSLAQACLKSGALLITDRVYEDLTFGLDRTHEPLLPGEIRVKSLSKMLGMAGERVGYALADPDRSKQLAHRHWVLISTPPVASQTMVDAQMNGIDASLRWVRNEVESRLELLVSYLGDIPTVTWLAPRGGMFAWLRTTNMPSSQAVVRAAHHKVTILGGPVFGAADELGYFRVNLGVDRRALEEGCCRLVGAFS